MTALDLIIRNGLVIDGTGAPRTYADIGINNGKIAAIGNLRRAQGREEIDAAGKLVAPGFITHHSHYDAALFWDPYCSNSGEHGVTTIVNANCGFSIAPVRAQDRERTMQMLSTTEQIPVEQQRAALPWDWETFPEYLDKLRALPKGINVMTLLPLNPLLVYVMGIDGAKTRRPTAAEMAEMHRLINEAMDLGAIGISMSVMGEEGNSHLDANGTVMPTDSLHDDDVVEICRAVIERGEGIIQMLSQIAYNGNRAVTEKVARLAKGSGARVLHNVFNPHDAIPQLVEEDLAWLDAMVAEGSDLAVGALIHCGWVEQGVRELDSAAGQMHSVREIMACRSDDEIRALMADPAFIARFSDEYISRGPASGAGGFEHLTAISVGTNPDLQAWRGRTLGDIAADQNKTCVEVLCDIAVRSNLDAQFKSAPWAALDGKYARKLLQHPSVVAGVSDGGAHTKAFSSGNYATELLIRLVREQKLFSVEEMHHQLSLKVARMLHLQDRGALLPGFWADIVIYDLDALWQDTECLAVVHDMPGGDWRRLTKSGGYDRIIVNGVTTHIADKSNGAVPGQLLRVTTDLRAA